MLDLQTAQRPPAAKAIMIISFYNLPWSLLDLLCIYCISLTRMSCHAIWTVCSCHWSCSIDGAERIRIRSTFPGFHPCSKSRFNPCSKYSVSYSMSEPLYFRVMLSVTPSVRYDSERVRSGRTVAKPPPELRATEPRYSGNIVCG